MDDYDPLDPIPFPLQESRGLSTNVEAGTAASQEHADAALGEARAEYDVVRVEPGRIRVQAPDPVVRGLVADCENRAGVAGAIIARGLLAGLSRKMAATAAGISYEALRGWCQRDKALGALMQQCEGFGFSMVVEGELYSRAFAGAEDKGSMRALEMVTKARGPEYREKVQIEHTLLQRAADADDARLAGFSDEGS